MNKKKIIVFALIIAMILPLCSCGQVSYDKIVEKAYTAIGDSNYDKARSYFGDTLSVMVGKTELINCANTNAVDNYISELIAKETKMVSISAGTIAADSAVMTCELTDKAMALATIPNEKGTITFYFTDNTITKMVYDNRDEYNANYTKYQGGGGKFYAQIQSDNTFKVTSVVKGGPAQKAGLAVGDIITAIDGANCSDMNATVEEQSIRCRGAVGTSVTLTVTRTVKKVEKTLTITFTRVAL